MRREDQAATRERRPEEVHTASRSTLQNSKNQPCCTRKVFYKATFLIVAMAGIIACVVALVAQTSAVDVRGKRHCVPRG